MTMKEEKELEKFWNNWKPTDKKTKSARGMEPAITKEPTSGMESARGMEIQRPEADTTDDNMKAKCVLVKKLRNNFTDDDKNVDRKEENYLDVVKEDKREE